MTNPKGGPFGDEALAHFLETFLYTQDAFFVDEVLSADAEARVITARMDTTRHLPIGSCQRVDPKRHPAHVSGPELILLTGNLGCLHAYFFHGCRWDEGWSGFGSRIHRADFRDLTRIGPPLLLRSEETKTRVGPKRAVLRFAYEFTQEGRVVYRGDQSAMFVKDADLTEG